MRWLCQVCPVACRGRRLIGRALLRCRARSIPLMIAENTKPAAVSRGGLEFHIRFAQV
jgi:hypothetical protein